MGVGQHVAEAFGAAERENDLLAVPVEFLGVFRHLAQDGLLQPCAGGRMRHRLDIDHGRQRGFQLTVPGLQIAFTVVQEKVLGGPVSLKKCAQVLQSAQVFFLKRI